MTPLEAARTYHRWRLCPLPLRRGVKAPKRAGWREFRVRDDRDLDRFFGTVPVNVGVLLGEPSGGVVDIDLDVLEAVELAPQHLPATATFGRASKRSSHWIYGTTSTPQTVQFKDPTTGAMLVELRSTGHQTVFPGSVHPSGEAIEWDTTNSTVSFATLHGAELRAAVARLAAATLLARHPNPSPVVMAAVRRWRGEDGPAAVTIVRPETTSLDVVERARRYLATMDPAVEGKGGNAQTFKAAVFLVKKFGLGEADALVLLREFNTRCVPPWTDAGLVQKLKSVAV